MCKPTALPCGCTALTACLVAEAMATEADALFARDLPAQAAVVIEAYVEHRAPIYLLALTSARFQELN
ncbi:hypothetical protein [Deinococcus ruber]|uniref:Uncharacterized protein n=1 Tax=Deinococcus ruber TaxID=1848197 RepID=A0A918C860_9DEIO|nr:hypothetical protein [Deinococcus ruber]GGR11580.1 hypothetical protein GCM10008957_25690 [Deinococcus ruber]